MNRLFGDFNSGPNAIPTVNGTDQAAFNLAYRSVRAQANYREYFNFDADNDVDAADQVQFNKRLNRYP